MNHSVNILNWVVRSFSLYEKVGDFVQIMEYWVTSFLHNSLIFFNRSSLHNSEAFNNWNFKYLPQPHNQHYVMFANELHVFQIRLLTRKYLDLYSSSVWKINKRKHWQISNCLSSFPLFIILNVVYFIKCLSSACSVIITRVRKISSPSSWIGFNILSHIYRFTIWMFFSFLDYKTKSFFGGIMWTWMWWSGFLSLIYDHRVLIEKWNFWFRCRNLNVCHWFLVHSY